MKIITVEVQTQAQAKTIENWLKEVKQMRGTRQKS